MGKFIDLTGQRFEKLTVLSKAYSKKAKRGTRVYYNCVCDCGNKTVVAAANLRTGKVKSCGCIKAERLKNDYTKHGKSHKSRLYNIWVGMRQRCYNSKALAYKYYGGRGIAVCEEWRNDFLTFYNWAMANGYNDNLTIDRVNVNGNYEPLNCRWVNTEEQANNTRANHLITYNNETHTMAEWARIYNINYSTLRARVRRGVNGVFLFIK